MMFTDECNCEEEEEQEQCGEVGFSFFMIDLVCCVNKVRPLQF